MSSPVFMRILIEQNTKLKKENESLRKELKGVAASFEKSELAPWFEKTICSINEYFKELDK